MMVGLQSPQQYSSFVVLVLFAYSNKAAGFGCAPSLFDVLVTMKHCNNDPPIEGPPRHAPYNTALNSISACIAVHPAFIKHGGLIIPNIKRPFYGGI